MRIEIGTIVRALKGGDEILVYSLRQGRKHPWHTLDGYNITNDVFCSHVSDGIRFEESYEILRKRITIEEMLTDGRAKVRQLGIFLHKNPKPKPESFLLLLMKHSF